MKNILFYISIFSILTVSGCASKWNTDWETQEQDFLLEGKNWSTFITEMIPAKDEREVFFVGSGVKGGRWSKSDHSGIYGVMDIDGNNLWIRKYVDEGKNIAFNAVATLPENTGYLIIGSTSSNGQYDMLVVKVNNSGDIIWKKELGTDLIDVAYDAVAVNEKIYAVTGKYGEDKKQKTSDAAVIFLNEKGNILKVNKYNRLQLNSGKALVVASDGNLILGMDSMSNYYSAFNVVDDFVAHVMKISTEGDVIWEKKIDDQRYFVSEMVTEEDGDVIILGGTLAKGFGGSKIFVMKLDERGNTEMKYIRKRDPLGLQGAEFFPGEIGISSNGEYIITGSVLYTGGIFISSTNDFKFYTDTDNIIFKLNQDGIRLDEGRLHSKKILDILPVDNDSFIISIPGKIIKLSEKREVAQ